MSHCSLYLYLSLILKLKLKASSGAHIWGDARVDHVEAVILLVNTQIHK